MITDNIGSPAQSFNYMKHASDLNLKEAFLSMIQHKTIEGLEDCQNVV